MVSNTTKERSIIVKAELYYSPEVILESLSGETLFTPVTFGPFQSIKEVEDWQNLFLETTASSFGGLVQDTKSKGLTYPYLVIGSSDARGDSPKKSNFQKVMKSKVFVITSKFPVHFHRVSSIPGHKSGMIMYPAKETLGSLMEDFGNFLFNCEEESYRKACARIEPSYGQQTMYH